MEISDNPSAKVPLDQLRAFEEIKMLVDQVAPLRALFPSLATAVEGLPALRQQAEVLFIPDRFNDKFSSLGWIAYESMHLPTMVGALEIASRQGIDAAEVFLADSYDGDTLKWGILRLTGHREFRKRIRLIELARDDYLGQRYHASIPLLLSLIDGLVNDITKHVGFFADGSNVTAFDSIAGHESGLRVLAELMSRGRNKTNEDPISVPYRNGILHGRELAFDNKINAAKCWAALFAIRDWAGALIEKKRASDPEKEPTWEGLREQVADRNRIREALDAWRPRELCDLSHLPHVGEPSGLPCGTPELIVAEFMENWRSKRFGPMAETLLDFLDTPPGKKAGRAKADFGRICVSSFQILGVIDEAASLSHVKVCATELIANEPKSHELLVRTIYHDSGGDPVMRGDSKGSWKIVQNSFSSILCGTTIRQPDATR